MDGHKKHSKTKKSSKKREKTNVPKSFIQKIKRLGLKEEDAEVLYETKIDWTAVYSDNKIYCTEGGEQKCDFVAEMKTDNVDLRHHLRTAHEWGDWPCTDKNCDYIAHSKKNRNLHQTMHKRRSDKLFHNKCPIVNCHSTFQFPGSLETHLRYHKNDIDECQFCPYRYIDPKSYKSHLRAHFRIKEFKCDKCGRLFGEIGQLNHHYSLHEGINYLCRICDLKYVASHKKTITGHLRKKHGDVVGENVNWEAVQKFILKQ